MATGRALHDRFVLQLRAQRPDALESASRPALCEKHTTLYYLSQSKKLLLPLLSPAQAEAELRRPTSLWSALVGTAVGTGCRDQDTPSAAPPPCKRLKSQTATTAAFSFSFGADPDAPT